MVLNGIRPHIQNGYRITPEEMESGAPPILLPVTKGLLGWWILSSRTNAGFYNIICLVMLSTKICGEPLQSRACSGC